MRDRVRHQLFAAPRRAQEDSRTHLNTRLPQMTNVARTLSRLDSHHDTLRVDGPEGVNDDFTLDGLDGIDDDGDCSRVQLFKGLQGEQASQRAISLKLSCQPTRLLSVDVDT